MKELKPTTVEKPTIVEKLADGYLKNKTPAEIVAEYEWLKIAVIFAAITAWAMSSGYMIQSFTAAVSWTAAPILFVFRGSLALGITAVITFGQYKIHTNMLTGALAWLGVSAVLTFAIYTELSQTGTLEDELVEARSKDSETYKTGTRVFERMGSGANIPESVTGAVGDAAARVARLEERIATKNTCKSCEAETSFKELRAMLGTAKGRLASAERQVGLHTATSGANMEAMFKTLQGAEKNPDNHSFMVRTFSAAFGTKQMEYGTLMSSSIVVGAFETLFFILGIFLAAYMLAMKRLGIDPEHYKLLGDIKRQKLAAIQAKIVRGEAEVSELQDVFEITAPAAKSKPKSAPEDTTEDTPATPPVLAEKISSASVAEAVDRLAPAIESGYLFSVSQAAKGRANKLLREAPAVESNDPKRRAVLGEAFTRLENMGLLIPNPNAGVGMADFLVNNAALKFIDIPPTVRADWWKRMNMLDVGVEHPLDVLVSEVKNVAKLHNNYHKVELSSISDKQWRGIAMDMQDRFLTAPGGKSPT